MRIYALNANMCKPGWLKRETEREKEKKGKIVRREKKEGKRLRREKKERKKGPIIKNIAEKKRKNNN